MFRRAASPTDETLRLAIEALRDQGVAVARSLQAIADAQAAAVEVARRQQDHAERVWAADEARRVSAQNPSADALPDVIEEVIRVYARDDAALRRHLVQFARTRLARGIPDAQVAQEIQLGDSPRGL